MFISYILPVLLAAPWPAIAHMEIWGVGRSWEKRYMAERPKATEPVVIMHVDELQLSEFDFTIRRPAIEDVAREQLRVLLPIGARLGIVEEEQERDYENLRDDHGLYGV